MDSAWNVCQMKAWVLYEQCCGTAKEGAAGCLGAVEKPPAEEEAK